jgi:hypothetical protein
MVWIATVDRPNAMPLDQVHVALYGYYPQCAARDARPYVWRLASQNTVMMASSMRPSAPSARQVMPQHGTTYDFKLVFKRTRNVGGTYTRPDGAKRQRDKKTIVMRNHDEIKKRLIEYTAPRGGAVKYVRIENMQQYNPTPTITLDICTAIGKVFVTDADQFDALLCSGGPSTGKAYGLGMWYLPEIMGE